MQPHQLGLALDALSSPLTILNQSGVIIYANKAWKRFADGNGLAMANYGLDCNYLEYCQNVETNLGFESVTVEQGISSVISGVREEFHCQYPCHSPTEERWFQMRVVPFDYEGCRHAIVIHENITDSKASENRLRNILENAPIGMAIVSLEGRFVEVNQALEDIIGYPKSELLNLTCEQVNHPDDLHSDEALMQGLLQGTQSSYRVEKRFLHKNGDIVWVSLTCSILRDEIGTPVYIIKQIQNITDKVKAETSLRNSEHRLHVVLNNMPALIGYWNKNLINEFGNKAYSEWFGISSDQITGMSLRKVIGEHLYSLNRPYIEKVLAGESQVFERIITDTTGKDHFTLASYIPDVSNNEVKGFFVLVMDITQAKMAELELRKSEQLSRMLLSVSIDGFNFADLNGHFLNVNLAFCQMLGYTKTEMLEMAVSDIEAAENPEQTAGHLEKIMANGFDRFESVLCRKDGSLVDVEVSVTYLSDKEQFFAFVRDITQRKQSEKLRIQQLEQQRDALVREVHHRIKNHLQGMVGLLNLYSFNQPAEKDLIQDIAAKIASIAAVYGIQGKSNQDNAYLCEITFEICKSLEIFGMEQSNIKYSVINHHRILLPSEYAVPIALIINELIINAIKHNDDPIPKNIEVDLSVAEHKAILTIQNSCRENYAFPDFEHGTGLGVGLSLVRAMLPKQGAYLSLMRLQDMVCAQLTLQRPIVSITHGPLACSCRDLSV